MADFEEVLSKAIAGLPHNTSELRRALYDRARTSLVGQLKNMNPPLQQTEIAKQRLALEHAIRKVESQSALSGLSQKSSDIADKSSTQKIIDKLNKIVEPVAPTVIISEAPQKEITVEQQHHKIDVEPSNVAPQHISEDKCDITSDDVRVEDMIINKNKIKKEEKAPIEGTQPPIKILNVNEDAEINKVPEEYSQHLRSTNKKHAQKSSGIFSIFALFKRPNIESNIDNTINLAPKFETKSPKFGRVEFVAFERKNMLRIGGIVLGFCALVVLFLSSDMIGKLISSVPKDVVGFKTAEIKTDKFTNRLEPEIELASDSKDKASAQAESFVNVAQTAILYEENPNIPQKGEAFKGQILWTAEQETAANGKIEKFLRGQIDIPARKMKMILTLRRNFDVSIPATHTVELLFELAPDFIQKGISSVPGILVKPAEQAKGAPLIGASARITSNYFLVALSSQAGDKERNISALKEKNWLEIPILYETRLRAVMVMNKGNSGEKVFQQVFDSWK